MVIVEMRGGWWCGVERGTRGGTCMNVMGWRREGGEVVGMRGEERGRIWRTLVGMKRHWCGVDEGRRRGGYMGVDGGDGDWEMGERERHCVVSGV